MCVQCVCERLGYSIAPGPLIQRSGCTGDSERLTSIKQDGSHPTREISVREPDCTLGLKASQEGCWWLLVRQLLPSPLLLTWHSPREREGMADTTTGRGGRGRNLTVIEQHGVPGIFHALFHLIFTVIHEVEVLTPLSIHSFSKYLWHAC